MKNRIKNTQTGKTGFDYQLLHGMGVLCNWLEDPDKYQRVIFECHDKKIAGEGIDDVVVQLKNGQYDFYQVKHTSDTESKLLSWKWFLKNVKHWYDAFRDKEPVNEFVLITTRKPDAIIEIILDGGSKMQFQRIPSKELLDLISELVNEDTVKWFISKFIIMHRQRDYAKQKNFVQNKFCKLKDVKDVAAFNRLLTNAADWARFKDQPQDDGWITYHDVKMVIDNQRPRPVPQDFAIPEGYQVPCKEFHNHIIDMIDNTNSGIITIYGTPGRGKSTYLSYLCKQLSKEDFSVVRHHYYIRGQNGVDRAAPHVVRESIFHQIRSKYYDAYRYTGERSSSYKDSLGDNIADYGEYFQSEGKKFIVVLDGLDHVWRENSEDIGYLNDIFNELMPLDENRNPLSVPDNVIFLIGTQNVDDKMFPDTFLQHSPKKEWHELPVMSYEAVRACISQYAKGEWLDKYNNEDVNRVSMLIKDETKGHPLQVLYVIGYLDSTQNRRTYIDKDDIKSIPGDLGGTMPEYYQAVWSNLKNCQKEMLLILVSLDIHWPHKSFESDLLIPDYGVENKRNNFCEIQHLLYESELGYIPFHNSLGVFLQEQNECKVQIRVKERFEKIDSWLGSEAPERISELWSYIVQAKRKRYKNLYNGLTKSWIIDRLLEGHELPKVIAIIGEAENIAINKKRYDVAYRLRHLINRMSHGLAYSHIDQIQFKAAILDVGFSDNLVLEKLEDIEQFEIWELLAFAKTLIRKSYVEYAKVFIEKAIDKHNVLAELGASEQDSGSKVEYFDELANIIDYAIEFDFENLPKNHFLLSADTDLDAIKAYLKGIAYKSDIGLLLNYRKVIHNKQALSLVEDEIIRIALNSQLPEELEDELLHFECGNFVKTWAALKGKSYKKVYTGFELYEQSGNNKLQRDSISQCIIGYFFDVLSVFVDVEYYLFIPKNEYMFYINADISDYFDALKSIAEEIAEIWNDSKIISIDQIYMFFDRLIQHPLDYEHDKRSVYHEIIRLLPQLVYDIYCFNRVKFSHKEIESDELKEIFALQITNIHMFTAWYSNVDELLFSENTVCYLLESYEEELKHTTDVSDLQRSYQDLLNISIKHNLGELSLKYCRVLWELGLGHGGEDDLVGLEILKAVDHLVEHCTDNPRKTIDSIEDEFNYLCDFTESDGHSSWHEWINKILIKTDPSKLVLKYKQHIFNEDWYLADRLLLTRFSEDLSSPVLDKISCTGLPNCLVKELSDRGESGDTRASELFTKAINWTNRINECDMDGGSSSSEYESKKFEGNFEEFPPDKFNEYCAALSKIHAYGYGEDIVRWFKFWKNNGEEEALLDNLSSYINYNDCRQYHLKDILDDLFDIAIKKRSADEAYKYIVQSQIEHAGWSRSQYHDEDKAQVRLKKVAKFYKNKSNDFIKRTRYYYYRLTHDSSRTILLGERLVFFLLQMNDINGAKKLIKAMTDCFKDDTKMCGVSPPSWRSNNTILSQEEIDINLLLSRVNWPINSIKLWAIQQAADLLIMPKYREVVEIELLNKMCATTLETELLELLYILVIAKNNGYTVPPKFIGGINSRSILSDFIIWFLYDVPIGFGAYRKTDHSKVEYTAVPKDLSMLFGRDVPLIIPDMLAHIDNKKGVSLRGLFYSEWEASKELIHTNDGYFNTKYFNNSIAKEVNVQFVSANSHRGRSAFLNTLKNSVDSGQLTEDYVAGFTGFVKPLSMTFCALRPCKPDWLSEIILSGDISDNIISQEVSRIVNLSSQDSGRMISFSSPIKVNENSIVDIDIMLCLENEQEVSDPEQFFNDDGVYNTLRSSLKIVGRDCNNAEIVQNMGYFTDDQNDYKALPLACLFRESDYGYLEVDLKLRGVPLPISYDFGSQVILQKNNGEILVFVNAIESGKISYWNYDWKCQSIPKGKSYCGASLVLSQKTIENNLSDFNGRLAYYWKCTHIFREESYLDWQSNTLFGTKHL